ncbi:uncharacterized protein B0I36DRAFT_320750 [Microdochium trichocladiopsis]|uniref:Translation initiation factor IF-3 n=1 Tax=Microdochium trichocladiopsis TaxID=1682393 RepID=A0A9P9BV91_9PEZI|nr:uncharacterized protein B0I36DRAFT_320750 [Microdochium trichocladiopsis]KAH7033087.1 hypothetical protein B0I36DRAFT_320750 [Microdochium trichocladiopsis]
MLPSQCPFSPSRALQRVFLAGLSLPIGTAATRPASVAARAGSTLAVSSRAVSKTRGIPPARHTNDTARHSTAATGRRGYAKLVRTPKQKQKPQVSNHDIPYQWIRIKQENRAGEEGDVLGPPERTDDVLRKLDMSRMSLVMLAPPPPPRPGEQSAAICKLVDLEEEARRAAAEQKEARKEKANSKELEFNWAIAKGDMEMKLNRLAEFLRKGMRVDVTLAKKRGSRAASVQEAEQLMANIKEAVAQVPHAKEVKKPDGQPGRVVRMSFEGPGKKIREQLAADAAEAEARAQERAKAEAEAVRG